MHYYSEMSARGDVSLHNDDNDETLSRITNVNIPFCVLHALDDPLITWKTVASDEGAMHPSNLVKSGSGNLMLLLTKRGGHVGWPIGWLPMRYKWKWMNDAAKEFVEAVARAKRSM
jgi:predicted alpha/beta-fold hydrolase